MTDFTYYFFVLFLWKLSKNVATDFFYSFPTISGDETKSGYVGKTLVLVRFEIFRKVNLQTLKFCGNLL